MRSTAAIKSHPIHPMLVAFPIGLWVMAFIFEFLGVIRGSSGLWSAGFDCVIAGCITAVLAAVAGAIDWWTIVPPRSSAKSRGLLHGSLNVLALILFIYSVVRQGSPSTEPDKTVLVVMAVGVVALGVSGWLGGTLVYRNQIGIDRRYAGAGKFKTRSLNDWSKPVCNQSELGDGQMLLASINGERVVVGRCSEGHFAFSDHCTHKGGPLSDGSLVGCVVQCPWHGSQFDIKTGRVVSGPAEEKVETYQVEIHNNEVYVKNPVRELKPAIPPKAA